jgi:hypothetical protein
MGGGAFDPGPLLSFVPLQHADRPNEPSEFNSTSCKGLFSSSTPLFTINWWPSGVTRLVT